MGKDSCGHGHHLAVLLHPTRQSIGRVRKNFKKFAIVHVISAYKNVISIMADRPSRVEALKNKGKDGGLYEVLGMW